MSVAVLALVAVAGISIFSARALSQSNQPLEEKQTELETAVDGLKTAEAANQKTIEDLAETNRSKEELIRELKHGRARIEELYAAYVAEKANIAEAVLRLARAYGMSEGQSSAIRKRLLTKLGIMAEKMPRLQREIRVPITTLTYREFLEASRERRLEDLPQQAGERQSNTGRQTPAEFLETLRERVESGQISPDVLERFRERIESVGFGGARGGFAPAGRVAFGGATRGCTPGGSRGFGGPPICSSCEV